MTRIRNRGEGMQLDIRGATVDVTVSGDTGTRRAAAARIHVLGADDEQRAGSALRSDARGGD